jgi:hypothetical protein
MIVVRFKIKRVTARQQLSKLVGNRLFGLTHLAFSFPGCAVKSSWNPAV